jgi:hypothetical protein
MPIIYKGRIEEAEEKAGPKGGIMRVCHPDVICGC